MKKIFFLILVSVCTYQFAFASDIDPSCKSYFDGCNNCSRSVYGGEMVCTLKACAQNQTAQCLEHFSTGSTKSTQIANPASVYCTQNGGTLKIQSKPDGSQYGVCMFEDNRQCEEWAFFRGTCPVGGRKITGYIGEYATYCAITGNTFTNKGEDSNGDDIGECKLSTGVSVDAKAYYLSGNTDPISTDTMCTMEYVPVCGAKQVQCIKAPCFPVTQTYGNKCTAEADNAKVISSGECLDPKVETTVQTTLTKIMDAVPVEKVQSLVERVVNKIDVMLSQENISSFKKSVLGYLKTLLQAY